MTHSVDPILDKAIARKREILDTMFPGHVPADRDRAVRDAFPIHLPTSAVYG